MGKRGCLQVLRNDKMHNMKQIALSVGIILTLLPLQAQQKGTLTDSRDGQTYATIRIGRQTWMAENLNYDTTGSFCYNDSAYYSEIYGRLYSWETATGACPEGWRLPSDIDWQELEICLGMNPDEVRMDFWRGEDEGARLKSKQGWNSNGNGTDNYGLSILPSGYRGIYGKYGLVGDYGYCWTSTGFSDKSAWYRRFGAGRNQILRYTNNKEQGYPVRCLKVE